VRLQLETEDGRTLQAKASEEKPERRPYDADGLSDDTLHFSLREKSVELLLLA
jgi:hypothetical protein